VSESYPEIEVISLSYNSERFLAGYFAAFARIDYPLDRITLNLVDNGSRDRSAEIIAEKFAEKNVGDPAYPIKVKLTRSEKNLGFTGGNNLALRRLLRDSSAPFFLLLNIDTEIHAQTLSELVRYMVADPSTGLVEARQEPKEHPKWYDPLTHETGWCSGGGVLIRAEALRQVGVFDDRFFLYCEDVDLSWRMWQQGWRCKINPQAVFSHFTETLDPEKDPSIQRYYSMRNGFLMHYKYDTWRGIKAYKELFFQLVAGEADLVAKDLLIRAYRDSRKFIPGVLFDRLKSLLRAKSPWIYFNGFCFEKRREFEDTADGRRIIKSAG